MRILGSPFSISNSTSSNQILMSQVSKLKIGLGYSDALTAQNLQRLSAPYSGWGHVISPAAVCNLKSGFCVNMCSSASVSCVMVISHIVNWYILTAFKISLVFVVAWKIISVSCKFVNVVFSPPWLLTGVWSYQHILSWPVCTCWASLALPVLGEVHRFFAAPESVFVRYFGRRANLAS